MHTRMRSITYSHPMKNSCDNYADTGGEIVIGTDARTHRNILVIPMMSRKMVTVTKPRGSPFHSLTPKLWAYLQAYAEKNRAAGNGFSFGMVYPDSVTRTLSARYYKVPVDFIKINALAVC